MECAGFPNISSPAAPFRPHSRLRQTTFRQTAPQGSERVQRFAPVYGAARQADVHSGSLIWIERILKVAYIQVFGKSFPSSCRAGTPSPLAGEGGPKGRMKGDRAERDGSERPTCGAIARRFARMIFRKRPEFHGAISRRSIPLIRLASLGTFPHRGEGSRCTCFQTFPTPETREQTAHASEAEHLRDDSDFLNLCCLGLFFATN